MSALRQALLLTAVFVGILASAGILAVSGFEDEFERRAKLELQTRFARVAGEIAARGFKAADYPNIGTEQVFFLPDGAASTPGIFRYSGFFDEDEADDYWEPQDDEPGEDDWLFLGGRIDGGRLVVATSLGSRELIFDAMFRTLTGIGMFSVLAALITGGILGLRSQRRMNEVLDTLSKVSGGDLTARIDPQRDRDDLDQLALRVDETVARLEVLMRQTREFSTNIAHDLKTPLARLRLRLERALTARKGDDDIAEEIRNALEQADGIIAIFDAFLRIARLEAGVSKAGFEPVDLAALACEVAETYAPVVEDSGRRLEVDAHGPAVIQGDRVLLIQMLANLVENGMRHTPVGTVLTLVANRRELGLSDTGPGIPSGEFARVVQPMYRLEKNRSSDGSGMGLSLARTIAELHGAGLVLSDNAASGAPGLFVRAEFPD